MKPTIVRSGRKMFEMELKNTGVVNRTIFRDTYVYLCRLLQTFSYNHIPLPLSLMPKTFGLKIRDKGYFPFLFNKEENLDVVLEKLPEKDDYGYEFMTKDARHAFEHWYEEHKNQHFHLAEELAAYCSNDTEILLHAAIEMQKAFAKVTKLDIFESKTLASAVMQHFQTNHLPNSKHLAIINERAYGMDRCFSQSTIARKYLKWLGLK